MRTFKRLLAVLLTAALLLGLVGCTAPASRQAYAAPTHTDNSDSPYTSLSNSVSASEKRTSGCIAIL